MKICKLKGSSRRSGLCRLAFTGEMTIFTAEQLRRRLLLLVEGYSEFELDLSQVIEIDTEGIKLLLMLRHNAALGQKPVKLIGVSEAVFDRLEIYELSDCFEFAQELELPQAIAN